MGMRITPNVMSGSISLKRLAVSAFCAVLSARMPTSCPRRACSPARSAHGGVLADGCPETVKDTHRLLWPVCLSQVRETWLILGLEEPFKHVNRVAGLQDVVAGASICSTNPLILRAGWRARYSRPRWRQPSPRSSRADVWILTGVADLTQDEEGPVLLDVDRDMWILDGTQRQGARGS